MFDTNAISALVHHRASWEQLARRIDGLATDQRLISTITLSELQTMIAKAEAPEAKGILVWRCMRAEFERTWSRAASRSARWIHC
jgi:predicted nucleic acid-binding protein